MRFSTVFLVVAALAFAFIPGCDSGTGGNGDGAEELSLGWAVDKADPVRDDLLSDGKLVEIIANDIDEDGKIEELGGAWQLYYCDWNRETDNILAVIVWFNGQVDSEFITDSSPQENELPEYRDAEPWVTAAIQGMEDEGYSDWEPLTLICEENTNDEYPTTLFLTTIKFRSPDLTQEAIVLVDADTDEVLAVLIFG
ncbi:hypothetical protein KAU45_04105 [bacterium]|nr:hypothetical protein [bacterium]